MPRESLMSKSIVKGIGIGFLSCIGIGIGIVKKLFKYWSKHPLIKPCRDT